MNDLMSHKGYFGSVRYSDEDQIFHGRLEFIRDLVAFEGQDVEGLRRAFEESVDDYLELCAAQGRVPEQPFRGTFNIRTGSRLHRRAALYARDRGVNLNAVVVEALERYLGDAEDRPAT
jgi:predicted HicB family RNase H-like nuclease